MKASSFGYSLLAVALLAVGSASGYWLGQAKPVMSTEKTAQNPERPALYWFDPMYPTQHFDAPGKSPFMDMALVPKYSNSTQDSSSISVPAQTSQNLGMRTRPVVLERLAAGLDAVGSLAYNQREIATLQARAGGFVERVYARAPGDVLPAGSPLADVLIPEWSAAQLEFIAVLNSGDSRLIDASRERLRLLGMPAEVISHVAKTRKARAVQTIVTPIAGELQTLDVRAGMAVSAGQNLASINGLSSVWLDSSIPEAQASSVEIGATVSATLAAYPGQVLQGHVIALLPSTDAQTRTLTVRSQLPNPSGKLRPGMFASVHLSSPEQTPALLIPSEAVIRTGKRTLVMLAGSEGRYQPQEIHTGREVDGKTEVLSGLREGQQVVTSGQFLLDSEASLQGILGDSGAAQ
ncbi:efflux RND transporter periplasmic adaptor subunit [Pseudomonas sp. NA-150]|uniref:efflux RND transporter periplasmic adaptor subunit n=1 Tax=Pseudomonas sp. NA-150 TaxID=3367525 RepID=UPI0037C94FBC